MRISKVQEKTLRQEFAALKRRVQKQEKANLVFVKGKCKNLLRACRSRWDFQTKDLSSFTDGSADILLYDLRN